MFLPNSILLITVLLLLKISTPACAGMMKKRTASSYAVEGCFSSFPSPGLNQWMGKFNSNLKCQETCRNKGYILAATKRYRCICGNFYPKGYKVSDSWCSTPCRSWSTCHGTQSCCGGPRAYSVSVVGNIDVAKQALKKLSHHWQTNKDYRKDMKENVSVPSPGYHDDNWWNSFNHKGWSLCGQGRYMRGLYRNKRTKSDPIYRLEEAYCYDAPTYLYPARYDRDCYDHNWWNSFDSRGWSTCNDGYYMVGLYRTSGNRLHNIEEAYCCRPKSQKKSWGSCYYKNVWKSFDSRGWSICDYGYYMVGLYRNSCDKLYCLEEFKCCKMGPYNGDSWIERPDLTIRVKDTSGKLKQCSMNTMDKSASSKTFKCKSLSDNTDMLELNALKFTIEDKTRLNVAKPQPLKGFRPVICSAHSNSYKCTKSLSTKVTTSSTLKIGSGSSVAVNVGASVAVSKQIFGIGAKATFTRQVTKTSFFNKESSYTKKYETTDKTDVSVQVPANTEIMINYLRTLQDVEYKWKAVFELLGKYSLTWNNGQKINQDVKTVLSGEKGKIYAFGTWRYPDTDSLRVVLTDKYGNEKASGCKHQPGKTQKSCNLKG